MQEATYSREPGTGTVSFPSAERLATELRRLLFEDPRLVSVQQGVDGSSGIPKARARALAARVANDVLNADLEETAAALDHVLGFGPLEPLLDDPEISEIMINGPHEVWVERSGSMYKSEARFPNSAELRRFIERIVGPLGLRADDSMPIVDARLADGSRFHAVLPPVAKDGPVVTIRKFVRRRLSLEDLVAQDSLSEEAGKFLAACVASKVNIVVSGGTSTGKTTLLNVLSNFVGDDERVVTVEDTAELELLKDHVVSLEARPPNADGTGEVTIRDLVRAALRMRPDRIVLGEVRGPEALDMLQAMNTGHEGSLTTVHANSPWDALLRIETMAHMANLGLSSEAVRQQIMSALDVVVQLSRLRGGRRVVTSIEAVPKDPEMRWRAPSPMFSRRRWAKVDSPGKSSDAERSPLALSAVEDAWNFLEEVRAVRRPEAPEATAVAATDFDEIDFPSSAAAIIR